MAGLNAFTFTFNLSVSGHPSPAFRENDVLWQGYLQQRKDNHDTPLHAAVEEFRASAKRLIEAAAATSPWGAEWPQVRGHISIVADLTPITEEPPKHPKTREKILAGLPLGADDE